MKKVPLPPITDEVIAEVRDRIVEAYDPEAIWLFGSAARGETGENSDVDLLLIMEIPEGVSYYEHVGNIHNLFWGMMLPADVFVLDREDFEDTRDTLGRLAYTATRHGKKLYGERVSQFDPDEPDNEDAEQ